MRTAEVVILGGGVVGASVAWHLAARGCRDVLVCERQADLGRGSTGRATGGFRAQFGTEINVRLSLLARRELQEFRAATGVDPGYDPVGYLFVATSPAQLVALREGLQVQRRAGLEEAREVTVEDIRELNPALCTTDVVGGTFCPTDGFVRPLDILRGYVEDAARRGVRFETGCRRAEGLQDGGSERRVRGVSFRGETVATRCVVLAAGAWSGLIGSLAGVYVPVRSERRQVAVTEPFDALPARMPMSIDCTDGFHLRVRDGRVLLLCPNEPEGADPFDIGFDDSWLDGLMARARHRVPCLESAPIDRDACWAGLYEMSPDRHALVGPVPGVPGLLLATGNSGHGVMHSPAIGRLVAETILDGEPRSLDIRALRPSRFHDGDPNPSSGVI